jgi:hypothetical protein
MTKNQLNEFYTKNWDEIELYTIKTIKHFNRDADISMVISESYIHLDKHIEELTDDMIAMSFVKNWIKMNLYWTNSPMLLKNRTISSDYEMSDNRTYEYTIMNFDVNYKKWEDEFYCNLTRINKNLWYMWWILGLKKGRQMAKHLNISISGAYLIINQCKDLEGEFRKFIKDKISQLDIT